MRWQNGRGNAVWEGYRSAPSFPGGLVRVGHKPAPQARMVGRCGAGHGVVIPCVAGGPWTDDSVELTPLKPNSDGLAPSEAVHLP
ncbi:hypothetical protein [Nitrosomonas communis]|uniref:hypothetical protein n=1 Tax=Nitrosomonas communis TaxID=44574 RepID=UPI0011150CD7|nr:hypothetical protein [Nitrosomonas communis]